MGQEPLRKGELLTISQADSLPESSGGVQNGLHGLQCPEHEGEVETEKCWGS